MKKYTVGIVGATGMVGQRFVTLLSGHPWFEIGALAASKGSSGKTYAQAVEGRWAMSSKMPENIADIEVLDASDVDKVASGVDFIFCAVDMSKDETQALEEAYAKAECPVVSNNSAHRGTPDVPMMMPEVNFAHSQIIHSQRKRLGTKRGFIAVKPNCSIQGYVPLLDALREFEAQKVLACTYQAISGAGKTFDTWPEMRDNLIPHISGEEQKSEMEPLKIWGEIKGGVIVPAALPLITTQCFRVPVSDGHTAAVFASFAKKPGIDEIKSLWNNYRGEPQKLGLPSAPKKLIHYFEEENRPQARLDRDLENGMAVSAGRLRGDSQYDIKFACLSHNTIRGAAGGAVLTGELLCAQGLI